MDSVSRLRARLELDDDPGRKLAGRSGGIILGGVKMEFDKTRPDYDRVVTLEIGGEPWDPDRIYKTIVTNFLMEGNSGLHFLTSIPPENVTPTQIKAVFDNLDAPEPRHRFTVGIEDDVTHSHVAEAPVGDHGGAGTGSHRRHPFVVGVEDRGALGVEPGQEVALLGGDPHAEIMAQRADIVRASIGLDYAQYDIGAIAFDYERLLADTGYDIAAAAAVQSATAVGNTPLLELHNITALVRRTAKPGRGARIFVKDEAANPSGSFKDRRASLSVHEAKRRGYTGVVAATSGNYGAVENVGNVTTHQLTGLEEGQRYYQLTHDYLVPSLRKWLTRKQKETRRGRAELRLAERAALMANINEVTSSNGNGHGNASNRKPDGGSAQGDQFARFGKRAPSAASLGRTDERSHLNHHRPSTFNR